VTEVQVSPVSFVVSGNTTQTSPYYPKKQTINPPHIKHRDLLCVNTGPSFHWLWCIHCDT